MTLHRKIYWRPYLIYNHPSTVFFEAANTFVKFALARLFFTFPTCMKNAKYSPQVQANFYSQQKMFGTSEKRLNKILERGEKF